MHTLRHSLCLKSLPPPLGISVMVPFPLQPNGDLAEMVTCSMYSRTGGPSSVISDDSLT